MQLHPLNASHILTNDLDGNGRDVIFDFPSDGLYSFKRLGPSNDVWTQIHPYSPGVPAAWHAAFGLRLVVDADQFQQMVAVIRFLFFVERT